MSRFNNAKKLVLAKALQVLSSEQGQSLATKAAPFVLARVFGRSLLGRMALRAGLGGFLLPLLAPVAVSLLTRAMSRRSLAVSR